MRPDEILESNIEDAITTLEQIRSSGRLDYAGYSELFDAIESISNGVIFQDNSPWHRAEDQLPEPGQVVLVCTYFYGRSIYAVAWLDNEEKWSFGTVTHWMPLPEPPKSDEL